MKARLKRAFLKEWMLRSNKPFAHYARKMGVSKDCLLKLLAGIRNPAPATRKALMKATGLSFDELFEIVQEDKK